MAKPEDFKKLYEALGYEWGSNCYVPELDGSLSWLAARGDEYGNVAAFCDNSRGAYIDCISARDEVPLRLVFDISLTLRDVNKIKIGQRIIIPALKEKTGEVCTVLNVDYKTGNVTLYSAEWLRVEGEEYYFQYEKSGKYKDMEAKDKPSCMEDGKLIKSKAELDELIEKLDKAGVMVVSSAGFARLKSADKIAVSVMNSKKGQAVQLDYARGLQIAWKVLKDMDLTKKIKREKGNIQERASLPNVRGVIADREARLGNNRKRVRREIKGLFQPLQK